MLNKLDVMELKYEISELDTIISLLYQQYFKLKNMENLGRNNAYNEIANKVMDIIEYIEEVQDSKKQLILLHEKMKKEARVKHK